MARTGRLTSGSWTVRLCALAVLAFLAFSFAGSSGGSAQASVTAAASTATAARTTAKTSPDSAGATARASAASASASTAGSAPGTETSGPSTASCAGSTDDSDWNPYLALDRWSSATSTLHVRLQSLVNFNVWDGFSINNPIAYMTNGALDDWFLDAGNWAWQTNEGLAQTAEQYCAIGRFGGAVDQTAGSLGKVLFNPAGSAGGGIAFVIVVGGIIVVVWRASRGRGSGGEVAKYLLKAGAVFGLAFVMLAGAAQTTNTSATSNTTTFGRGSPGWMLNVVNDAVTQVGDYATKDIQPGTSAEWYTPGGGADQGTGPGTCDYFMNKMHADYDAIPDASQTANAISQMWESSGLLLWVRAQMGTGTDTPATDRSFCFIADMMSSVQGSPDGYTAKGSDTSYAGGGSATFDPQATTYVLGGWSAYPVKEARFDLFNDTASVGELSSAGISVNESDANAQDWLTHRIDITGAGYVICQPEDGKWAVDAEDGMNAQYESSGQVTNGDCSNEYRGTLDQVDSSHLNIKQGTENQISPYPAGLIDFIGSWHGYTNNGVSLMATLSYMIASLVMLVVFGAVSLGVIVAKTLLIAAGIFMFFLLILELFPAGAGESRLPKYFRFTAGCALSTVALSLLLAIISKITWFVTAIAGGIAGQGSIFSMITYAFAPLVAVMIVHVAFTHLLKLPSPVKISSALKYAEAASGGAIGGSAAAGVETFGRYVKDRAMYGTARRGMRFGKRGLGAVFGGAGGAAAGDAAMAGGFGRQPEYTSSGGGGGESGIGTFRVGAKRSGAVEAALRRAAKETGDPDLTEKTIDKAREDFFADPANQEKIGGQVKAQKLEEKQARKERRREALVQGMMNAPLRTTARGVGKVAKTAAKVGLATGLAVFGGPVGAGIVAASVGRRLVKKRYEGNRASIARHDRVWEQSQDFQVLQEKVSQAASKRRRMVRDQVRKQAGGGQSGPGPLSRPSGGADAGSGYVQQAAARRKENQSGTGWPGGGLPTVTPRPQAGGPRGPVTGQPGPGVVKPRPRPQSGKTDGQRAGQQSGTSPQPQPGPRPGTETQPGPEKGQEPGGPGKQPGAGSQVDGMKGRLPRPARDLPGPGDGGGNGRPGQ